MRFRQASSIAIAAALAGCGQSEPVVVIARAPHGGTLAGLPDGQGRIELVRQEVAGKPDQSRLTLYLLDNDGRPVTPGPTAATLKPKGRGLAPVTFKPAADALESDPIAASGDISGELSLTIAGKPVNLVISVR